MLRETNMRCVSWSSQRRNNHMQNSTRIACFPDASRYIKIKSKKEKESRTPTSPITTILASKEYRDAIPDPYTLYVMRHRSPRTQLLPSNVEPDIPYTNRVIVSIRVRAKVKNQRIPLVAFVPHQVVMEVVHEIPPLRPLVPAVADLRRKELHDP